MLGNKMDFSSCVIWTGFHTSSRNWFKMICNDMKQLKYENMCQIYLMIMSYGCVIWGNYLLEWCINSRTTIYISVW